MWDWHSFNLLLIRTMLVITKKGLVYTSRSSLWLERRAYTLIARSDKL